MQIYWEGVILGIILMVAPLLGSALISFLNKLADRQIPPFLEQINSYTFGQIIVVFVSAIVISTTLSKGVIITVFIIIIGLIFTLLWHALINKKQLAMTKEQVKNIIDSRVTLRQDVNKEDVINLAYQLVDVDFIPESLPNKWSDFPRRKKRELLVYFINNYFSVSEPGKPQLNEQDFLIPPDGRVKQRRLYGFVALLSFIIYCISALLLIFK